MIPETFYLTGAGWLGYFVYVPIALAVIAFLYWLLLRRIPIIAVQIISLIMVSIPLLTFPLWEALSISYEAEKLCKEQGGLHVYKTVETDGFIGGWGIETAAKYGFSYVENGGGKYMGREILKDGKVNRESITEYKSRYHVGGGAGEKINSHITRLRSASVKDRETAEIIGELIIFQIYPSYFDLIMHIPFLASPTPWICGNEAPEKERYYDKFNKRYRYTFSDLIKATLKPRNKDEG